MARSLTEESAKEFKVNSQTFLIHSYELSPKCRATEMGLFIAWRFVDDKWREGDRSGVTTRPSDVYST